LRLLSGFQPGSYLSTLAFKAHKNLGPVNNGGYRAGSLRVFQHDFKLLAVFDDIDIFNGATLFGKRFPSGAGKRSGVFPVNQYLGWHVVSS